MKEKIITFRADNQDLERIEQIKEVLQINYNYIRINTSDVIKASIMDMWNNKCLPFIDKNNI